MVRELILSSVADTPPGHQRDRISEWRRDVQSHTRGPEQSVTLNPVDMERQVGYLLDR